MRNLSELKINQTARIKDFLDKDLSVKLMEMGCLPGTEIKIQLIAPFGDPIAVSVSDYCLSIRKRDAKKVLLED